MLQKCLKILCWLPTCVHMNWWRHKKPWKHLVWSGCVVGRGQNVEAGLSRWSFTKFSPKVADIWGYPNISLAEVNIEMVVQFLQYIFLWNMDLLNGRNIFQWNKNNQKKPQKTKKSWKCKPLHVWCGNYFNKNEFKLQMYKVFCLTIFLHKKNVLMCGDYKC